eukprot:7274621-Pyramimonas_sp.AAC.1
MDARSGVLAPSCHSVCGYWCFARLSGWIDLNAVVMLLPCVADGVEDIFHDCLVHNRNNITLCSALLPQVDGHRMQTAAERGAVNPIQTTARTERGHIRHVAQIDRLSVGPTTLVSTLLDGVEHVKKWPKPAQHDTASVQVMMGRLRCTLLHETVREIEVSFDHGNQPHISEGAKEGAGGRANPRGSVSSGSTYLALSNHFINTALLSLTSYYLWEFRSSERAAARRTRSPVPHAST